MQLDERHLDLGMAADLGASARSELADGGVGEAAGHGEEAAVAALAGVGDRGLDQVPEVVEPWPHARSDQGSRSDPGRCTYEPM